MLIGISEPAFLLLDGSLNPVAFNAEAVRVLAFPEKTERIQQPRLFLADKARSSLVSNGSREEVEFIRIFKSGKRRYTCKVFSLDCSGNPQSRNWTAVLLERYASGVSCASELSQQFDLTAREQDVVGLLQQGLTSKEIASRMNISPNTVKAFLRLVMVKMDVSTRSGIVGKMVHFRDAS